MPRLTKEQKRENARHIDQGKEIATLYAERHYFTGKATPAKIKAEGDCPTVDLIADLLHYAHTQDWDTEAIVRRAENHFSAELAGID